jgi:trk system potassium uptake protein TrkH
MLDLRPILLVNGILLSIISVVMLIPAVIDLFVKNEESSAFLVSSFFTAFVGGGLYLTNRGHRGDLDIRQAFLFTTSSWVIVPIFAAMPFILSAELKMGYADAYFESVSGLTATGASVMRGLDSAPPGILLWRALLNAMGGIGIVVLALAILPMLRIGGMQLFRTESSDTMDKILPRTGQIAFVISMVFLFFTSLCALSYWIAGMHGFDAICHALTTVATGGFSTHDQSIGYYNSVQIELVAMVFMLIGAMPMILFYQAMRGHVEALWRSSQVRWFLGIVAIAIMLLTLWIVFGKELPFWQALRYVSFNVIAVITTTGYSSADYASWGTFATTLFFMLIVVGGCTGSTSGGIKVFRFQVLYQTTKTQVQQLIQPHGVFIPQYNGKQIPDQVSASVMSFFLLFAFSFMILAIVISWFGLDFLTSMSAAAQALSNVGPGLGDIIGPAGSYSTVPEGVKWILAGVMIMGRLELFTVLVLLSPQFWRN